MTHFKCILFDCDGVLVDSETIASEVLLEMSRPYGLTIDLTETKRLFHGRQLKACFALIEERTGKPFPPEFEKEYRRVSFQRFNTELQPVEGVKDFLSQLTIPFAVASSGPVEKIRLNLTVTGLIHFFENKIFSSYQINSWKPEPGIFLHAVHELGYAVRDCIVVEDSVAGVRAGLSGGFNVFALATETNATELRNEGATVFFNYNELKTLLFSPSTQQ